MTQTEATPTVQFEGYTFDEASGELVGPGGEGARTLRIPPQPAKLLGHLIRRRPEIVGLDEIRELLWPDAHVEFEKSLHTCIRRIRSALGDSASEPRFVETVPRRGYRFLVEAQAVAASTACAESAPKHATAGARPERADPRRRAWVLLALAAALLAIVAWRQIGGEGTDRTRVAVMPFEPVATPSALAPGNDFAEALVHRLVADGESSLEVIGPTTTQSHPERTGALAEWMETDHVDYVINGRELLRDGHPRVLVEILRGRDGAHVWAQYMDELPEGDGATRSIAEALAEELAHPRERRP